MRALQLLREPHSAYVVWCALWPEVKQNLLLGQRLEVEIRPERRNAEQNQRFHAMCGDIAKSGVEWAGKRRTAVQWKVLLVSGHAVATGEGSEMVPGLENEFVNIRESTAEMSVRRGASLIDYTRVFGDMSGVTWKEPLREEA